LRVGKYRVFYDVYEALVRVNSILLKNETPALYRKD
jgi:hypothetical protein